LKPVSAIARSSAVAVAARVVFAVLSPDQLQRQMRVLLQLLANVFEIRQLPAGVPVRPVGDEQCGLDPLIVPAFGKRPGSS